VTAQAAGAERALLRLQDVSLSSTRRPDSSLRCQAEFSLELHDLQDKHLALHCQSVHATVSVGPSVEQVKLTITLSLDTVHLDTTEAFIAACCCGLSQAYDMVCSLTLVSCILEKRPFGLRIQESIITHVSGEAEIVGIRPGSFFCAIDPAPPQEEGFEVEAAPSEMALNQYLESCPMPVTLLFWPPYAELEADIHVASFQMCASHFSSQAVEMKVDQAVVEFESFQLEGWRGTAPDLWREASTFFIGQVTAHLPWVVAAMSLNGQNVGSYTAGLLGCSLFWLRFGGARAGAVGHLLAKSAVAATTLSIASAAKGRELRGVPASSGFCLEDTANGLLVLACARGRAVRLGVCDETATTTDDQEVNMTDATLGSAVGVADFGAQVVPSTVGAVFGGMLGEVLGPVGAIAGAEFSRIVGNVGGFLAGASNEDTAEDSCPVEATGS